jgi:hypothetical protein
MHVLATAREQAQPAMTGLSTAPLHAGASPAQAPRSVISITRGGAITATVSAAPGGRLTRGHAT